MKRTVLSKMAMTTGILLVCATMHGVYAADLSKPAAAGSEAAPQKKGEAKEAVTGAANVPEESKGAAEEEALVTLKVPLGSPFFSNTPVALVNDDKITLEDFDELLTTVHQSATEEGAGSSKSFADLMKRLINIRLFVQEARNIELDQLPEIKEMLDQGTKKILRETLYLQIARKVKLDEKEVEKTYNQMRKEVKLKSLAFKEEKDAIQFVKEVKAGKSFDDLAATAVQEKLAEVPGGEDTFAKLVQLHPKVAKVISPLEVNAVSTVVPLGGKFLVFKVMEIRNDDNPDLKETARANLLNRAQLEALKAYKLVLYKKYLTQNTKLINRIDFDAKKPGFDKMLADKRVLVAVKGDKPITVSDLATTLKIKFFHGVEIAAGEKKINREKKNVLDEMMNKIVFTKEATAQHLDKTDEGRRKIDEFTRSTLFGVFIEKAVRPDVKGTEEDLKAYYKEHIKKYTYPELVRLDQIVYKKSADAKSAIDKLRKGMEFKWLQTNAEGLVDKDDPKLQNFAGDLVTTSSMPQDVQKALAGVKLGDYRFYQGPEGYGYVLYVESVEPAKQQPFNEVRDDIMQAVYKEKLAKAVDDWGDKLSKAAKIKIYLDLGKKK